MEKRAILIISIIGIMLLLFVVSFVFAQDNGEEEQVSEIELSEQTLEKNTELIVEKELSPEEAFLQYLEEKMNELPDEEKEKFEKFRKMEPAEAFLKAIERYQPSKEEE